MKKVKELTRKWNRFNEKIFREEYYDFSVNNYNHYRELMIESFEIIRNEWNNEKISKELCFLLMSITQFSERSCFDDDGNCSKEDLYSLIIGCFHNYFVNLFDKKKLPLKGDLLKCGIDWDDDEPIIVNVKDFDFLDFDGDDYEFKKINMED